MGITVNHCKDPYETTSIMESKRPFVLAQEDSGCSDRLLLDFTCTISELAVEQLF